MAELKTQQTKESAVKFLQSIEPEQKRLDGIALLKIFKKVTGKQPVMWGPSIIGFGKYHYKSERSPQEGDWPIVAFSPRKQNLSLYILTGNDDSQDLLEKLGKHKAAVGCLYINKLADVDQKILEKLIKKAFLFKKEKPGEFPSNISAPALRALLNAKIPTLAKLSKHTEADILKLHGMGPASLPVLRAALKAKGLGFKK